MRSLTLKLVPIIALAFFFVPSVPAEAAGLTSAQVQAILGLLQSFGADASVIANVTAALGGTPAPSSAPNLGNSTSVNSASCVALARTLYRGVSDTTAGGEVLKLQQFLGIEGANGYFGAMTEAAVQKWQVARGLASPGASGYGVVGPKTRAAMACSY